PPTARPIDGLSGPGYVQGQEREVVIMFIDIRESTKLAEHKLPFDVVFILNQFFSEMADTLEDTGGHYAQFNGDGLMALYGLDSDLKTASVQALQGVQQMIRRLDILNQRLSVELHQPLRMGIGIHCGDAIVGQMGPPKTPIITALGDNVNIAARLEAMTKEFGVQVVISSETVAAAELDFSNYPLHDVEVRGRENKIGVYAVEDPKSIPVPAI
ncbi:MAG: adenylate/guanylate cyclase domain-containing protein, partial [Rhodospirillales bacterium]|nr:adenylate/guanylate cyclase domain-containing protein [Rhodospirillales bacterium]